MNTKYNPDFAENSIDAVVLAGKSKLIVPDNFNITIDNSIDLSYKAIIPINEKPMLSYVAEAIDNSKYINNIYIIGGEEIRKICFSNQIKKLKFVDDQGSFVDNLIEGGNESRTKKILYSTSDIPLITSKDIDNFIAGCSHRRDGHFYLAYYLREDYEKNFSGVKSGKFYQLGEKFIKNGYIFMLDRDFLNEINKNKAIRNTIAFLYSGRKKGLWPYLKLIPRYLSFASLSLLIKYKRRTLTIDEAEKILSGIIKHNIVAIKSSSQVGIDVDSYEELQNIEKIIKKQ